MQDQLFPHQAKRAKTPPGGPIYQGVAAQFRALFPSDDPKAQAKKAELKGWLALALAHARAIDNEPRPTVGRAQTSSELREVLASIADAVNAGDAFDDFLEEISRADGRTETPHTPV